MSNNGVPRIRQGYSLCRRPDLNQTILDMGAKRKAGLPVLMKPLSGNAGDSGGFPGLIDRDGAPPLGRHGLGCMGADSSLYGASRVEKFTESGGNTNCGGSVCISASLRPRRGRMAMRPYIDMKAESTVRPHPPGAPIAQNLYDDSAQAV